MTKSPDSDLFLAHPLTAYEDDVEVLDDADTTEIPASKSVPPHVPPSRVVTHENELPSVIVDLKELEMAEAERISAVEGLLFTVETQDQAHAEPTRRSVLRPRPFAPATKLAIALVAALGAAGATFGGLKVSHVAPGSIGASLHGMR
jgi:hypothetical protein